MNKKAYARCRACDTQYYPRWREDIEQFEDMCDTCIPLCYESINVESNEQSDMQELYSLCGINTTGESYE